MSEKKIYEKFDRQVMHVVIFAKAASINAQVDCIYPESFMIGILTTGVNEVTSFLVDKDINLEKCLQVLKKELASKKDQNESQKDIDFGNLKISRQIMDVCKEAETIRSEIFKTESIGVRHIFMALFRTCKNIRDIFEAEGITAAEIIEVLGRNKEHVPAGTSPKNREHKLVGKYNGLWECHVEPDWLLVYKVTTTEAIFVRTGSHSDLFN